MSWAGDDGEREQEPPTPQALFEENEMVQKMQRRKAPRKFLTAGELLTERALFLCHCSNCVNARVKKRQVFYLPRTDVKNNGIKETRYGCLDPNQTLPNGGPPWCKLQKNLETHLRDKEIPDDEWPEIASKPVSALFLFAMQLLVKIHLTCSAISSCRRCHTGN